MAKWYYFNESNEKIGPVRGRDLKQLVQEGTVTQNTRVEDENGRIAFAKNVTGLPFHEMTKPDAVPSKLSTVMLPPAAGAENGTKSTAENLGEQDFAQLREDFERLQKQQEQQQVANPAAVNPFTASMPVAENPFITPMPAAVNPFATPLTEAYVPIIEDCNRKSFVEMIVSMTRSVMTLTASMVAFVLNLIASMTAFILVVLLCGFVALVLLWLFYIMHPDVTPPGWLKPMILQDRQDVDVPQNPEQPDTSAISPENEGQDSTQVTVMIAGQKPMRRGSRLSGLDEAEG